MAILVISTADAFNFEQANKSMEKIHFQNISSMYKYNNVQNLIQGVRKVTFLNLQP